MNREELKVIKGYGFQNNFGNIMGYGGWSILSTVYLIFPTRKEAEYFYSTQKTWKSPSVNIIEIYISYNTKITSD